VEATVQDWLVKLRRRPQGGHCFRPGSASCGLRIDRKLSVHALSPMAGGERLMSLMSEVL